MNNNEIDIDGQERRLDYLGSEDSFTFSWGFQSPFAGHHAGMPLVQIGDLNMLSIYRFHDHMPIRFTEELTWSINWKHEFWQHPQWLEPIRQRKDQGGCWVDYATVFYWYADNPAGFEHKPLRPVDERIKDLLKSSRPSEAEAEGKQPSHYRYVILNEAQRREGSGLRMGSRFRYRSVPRCFTAFSMTMVL